MAPLLLNSHPRFSDKLNDTVHVSFARHGVIGCSDALPGYLNGLVDEYQSLFCEVCRVLR